MKQLLATAALAVSFALPISAISTTTTADPHYWVAKDSNLRGADGKVEIRSRAHGEGKVVCVIPRDEYLHRHHEENWSRWIHVEWKKVIFNDDGEEYRTGSYEWEFKDARGRWCPIWDRNGWIDKADPDLLVVPGNPSRRNSHKIRVPNTWSQTVHTTGRWGNDVPVFTDSDTYVQARESMDANGHYNGQANRVVCKLRRGAKVVFSPHRNWGMGRVWPEPYSNQGCKGWIDKGVIQ